MRRLVNLFLILVVLGAVGFLLVKARIINLPGRQAGPQPPPTAAPPPLAIICASAWRSDLSA